MLFACLLLVFTALLGGAAESAALVRLAMQGQQAAFRQLVRRLVPVIRARVRRQLAFHARERIGSHDGDDLTQEIWLTLLQEGGRQLLGYDPTRGMTLEGYVGRIAEREVGNRLVAARAAKRGGDRTEVLAGDALPETPAAGGNPEDETVARDLAAAVTAHLHLTLPERGRLVLELLYRDGHSPDTAARLMGVNGQVVYNWQHKIRSLSEAFLSAQGAG